MGERKKHKKALEKKIMEVSEGWTPPFAHDSSHKAKVAILSRIGQFSDHDIVKVPLAEERKAPRVIRINSLTWMQAAAAIIVLVSLPYIAWIAGNERLENNSEGLTLVELPDGSDVNLASGATIEYNDLTWIFNRKLVFHGEGFFEVEPGSTFEVSTPAGDVYVVGTRFSVWANGSSLLVHCAEGRVVVDLDDGEIVLNAGEFTRRKAPGSLSPKLGYATKGPLFPSGPGEMDFENIPLGLVLAQIEDASNITIFSSLDESLLYTGTLNLNRTKECLELVCKPFGAKFETNAEGYVTITP